MEHLKELLKVWADLHNKPSKTPKERQMMNELASILPRYGGGPVMQKMKVVRAGGSVEVTPDVVMESPKETIKRVNKAVKEAPSFVDSASEYTQFEETPAVETEKKSPQSSEDPESVAEAKRGRKAKVKD